MNFLLDENVPLSVKKAIENFGYKTLTLQDENKLGARNGEVAKLSIEKNAVIITLDSDFLSLKQQIQKKCKIIYIKLHPRDPKIIEKIIKEYLEDAIAKLNKPGKITLTKKDIKFDSL